MTKKNILLVSDMVGVGAVALSAMIPVMASLKTKCSYLPTAMVSNNFGYGKVALHDLSDYMDESIDVWNHIGFEFDMIVTGIVLNERQVELIERLISNQKKKPIVISDPIMGDNGVFYDGLSNELYKTYLRLIESTTILTPNVTELSKILEKDYIQVMEHEVVVSWLEELKLKGISSIALTSVHTFDGHFVYVYENFGDIQRIPYTHLPYDFGGTGDVFTSLISAGVAHDHSVFDSAKTAVAILSQILENEAKTNYDAMKIIHVEDYLDLIMNSFSR